MRGKPAPKRNIQPDPQYQNATVARFINHVLKRGKKRTAERVVYGALDIIKQKTSKEPLAVFEEAMKVIAPAVEVKSRRIGGANYQIPIEVRGTRREALAMRWIIDAARGRKAKSMAEGLAAELLDALSQSGEAFKKKEDVRRMAEANRAFAHFA
ncbi:MAG: 30S ribosomal protein S7 [Candidatus Kerfeldbacteria bacterium]|nr:30S ribosomal protein S7 [Candidatus Kerfeldbacteria bacterium]